jgi:hypothetical protein
MHLLTLLIGAPAVVMAVGVSVLETYRLLQPNAPLFRPSAPSLADAIIDDDVRGAYELLRAGQDPAAPITVRHLDLTGDRPVRVAPLLWAVATGSDWAVSMLLLRFGVRLDAETQHRAICLAEQLGRPDIVRLLMLADPHGSVGSCPDQKSSDGPLLVD